MKIYFAGNVGIISIEKQLKKLYKHRLLSYWDIKIITHRAGQESFDLLTKNLKK